MINEIKASFQNFIIKLRCTPLMMKSAKKSINEQELNFLIENLEKVLLYYYHKNDRAFISYIHSMISQAYFSYSRFNGAIFDENGEDLVVKKIFENLTLAIQTIENHQGFKKLLAIHHANLADRYLDRFYGDQTLAVEKAIEHYNLAIKYFSNTNQHKLKAKAYCELADIYHQRLKGDPVASTEKAIEYCSLACKVITRWNDLTKWCEIQNKMGVMYIESKSQYTFNAASYYFNEVLKFTTPNIFPLIWADTQINLAKLYLRYPNKNTGYYEGFIHHFSQAKKVYKLKKHSNKWLKKLIELGEDIIKQIPEEPLKNQPQKIRAFKRIKALNCIFDEISIQDLSNNKDAHMEIAILYQGFAKVYPENNWEHVINHLNQYSLLVDTKKSFVKWVSCILMLAVSYASRETGGKAENIERSLYYGEMILKHVERLPMNIKFALFEIIGMSYYNRINGNRKSNIELGIKYLEKALKLNLPEKHTNMPYEAFHNLGFAYIELHEILYLTKGYDFTNLETARKYFKKALADPRLSPINKLSIEFNIFESEQKEYLRTKNENYISHIMKCRKALIKIDKDVNPEDWAIAHMYIGQLYQSNKLTAINIKLAIKHLTHSLEIFKFENYPHKHYQVISQLGHLYYLQGDWQIANEFLTQAIDTSDYLYCFENSIEGRKEGIKNASNHALLNAYCLLKLGKQSEAIICLENGKAKLIGEELNANYNLLDNVPIEMKKSYEESLKRQRDIKSQLRSWKYKKTSSKIVKNLTEMLRQANITVLKIITQLKNDHPKKLFPSQTIADILSIIQPNSALVIPLITEKGSAVFVIPYGLTTVTEKEVIFLEQSTYDDLHQIFSGGKQGELKVNNGFFHLYNKDVNNKQKLNNINFKNDSREDISNIVDSATNSRNEWLSSVEIVGSSLWRIFIGQVNSRLIDLKLPKGSLILFNLSGWLNRLPISTSWSLNNNKRKYFIEDYTINCIISCYTYKQSTERLSKINFVNLLTVTNPTIDLAFSEQEGKLVSNIFKGTTNKNLTGNEAKLDDVVKYADQYSYLHFACHGFYNVRETEQRSGLLLANNEILSLNDITDRLNLKKTRLVTLSACETGMTDILQPAEEYVGLTGSFIQAGAIGVLSSFWTIPDEPTMLFMEIFYSKHIDEGLEPAYALRETQLLFLSNDNDPNSKILSDYNHPSIWSAFNFLGV